MDYTRQRYRSRAGDGRGLPRPVTAKMGAKQMETAETIQKLKKAGGCFELYHATTFKGYRNDEKGNVREVTITILDEGAPSPTRYHVRAQDEKGRAATGNSNGSLDAATAITHWSDLNRDR